MLYTTFAMVLFYFKLNFFSLLNYKAFIRNSKVYNILYRIGTIFLLLQNLKFGYYVSNHNPLFYLKYGHCDCYTGNSSIVRKGAKKRRKEESYIDNQAYPISLWVMPVKKSLNNLITCNDNYFILRGLIVPFYTRYTVYLLTPWWV